LLAEPDRLRVYSAVVLGADLPSAVADRTGMSPRSAVAALRRLQQGGLIDAVDGRLVARTDAFKESVREYAPSPAEVEPLDPDRQKDTILRTFIVDGRLVQIPAARSKRRVILEHLAACFEPGVKYPEKAVDAILRAWYSDYASLRRYLIDEQLLARENAIYWRAGGYVDVA
jgi:DNA-binding transcriptional ArsR family regulator